LAAHVGFTACAEVVEAKLRGTEKSNPTSKVETERSEVNLLNIAFNQDLPSLSARLL
jgi:hypothetical protein